MQWQYRDTVLALSTLAFFVTFYARVAISPVVPFITADFAITNTQVGIALSGMWIAYGLTQYPSGIFADRYGERRVILVSVGGTAALSFAAAISPVFALFVLAVIGLGAVAGLHYTVASTLLSRTYKDIGTAIGIHALGAPAAGLVAPILSAWLAVRYGWRPAVALVALFAVPVFLVFLWRVRPTEPRRPGAQSGQPRQVASFTQFLARPTIAFSAIVAIIAMFVINGILSFLPTFLIEFHDYSPTLAATAFSAYFILGAVTQVGVGAVSDRYSRDAVVAACLLLGTVGLFAILQSPRLAIVSLGVFLFAVGTSYFVALEPKILEGLSSDDRNAGFGVFRTVYLVGGSMGSIGVGAASDILGWGATIVILGGLFCLSFLLVVANTLVGPGY